VHVHVWVVSDEKGTYVRDKACWCLCAAVVSVCSSFSVVCVQQFECCLCAAV